MPMAIKAIIKILVARLLTLLNDYNATIIEYTKGGKSAKGKLRKLLAVYSLKVVAVLATIILLAVMIILGFHSLLGVWTELWGNGMTRIFILITGAVLGFGLVFVAFNKLGKLTVTEMPTEAETSNNWRFLQGILFDILVKVGTPIGIKSPASLEEITPHGARVYRQGLTNIYVFTVLRLRDVNLDTIIEVIETELRISQQNARLGTLGTFNANGVMEGGVLCIDVVITGAYIKIELALTDGYSYDIRRKRKLSRITGVARDRGRVDNEI